MFLMLTLEEYCSMNSKPIIVIAGIVVAVILLTGACSAGFVAGNLFGASSDIAAQSPLALGLGENQSANEPHTQAATPADLEELFAPFWQTWELVEGEYVDQPVDNEIMMRGAIQGMLEALGDDHTSYLDPEMFERSTAELEGDEYEGIGAWVDITGEYLTIISPMPGSPAEEAGLKPNDKVIAVDGEDMTGVDGEAVRQQVLGPRGTTVILTIQREGMEEPFDVEIKRASIVVPTVESKIVDENIAYVRLYTFGADTGKDLRDALDELLAQDPDGLILDLRFNGGGYLDTAIEVVSEFIGDGIVMYEEYGDGTRIEFEAKPGGLATEIPLVVMINEGSASASEIVAGAIQDRGRGELVGATTFGKGSVQTYQPLINDQGAVRVTIARWLTPDGRQIMSVGLEPDYIIVITEENFDPDLDLQLEKAIEVLTQE
jgi:carboxyl-terminal processing protease